MRVRVRVRVSVLHRRLVRGWCVGANRLTVAPVPSEVAEAIERVVAERGGEGSLEADLCPYGEGGGDVYDVGGGEGLWADGVGDHVCVEHWEGR